MELIQIRHGMRQYKIRMHFPYQINFHQTLQAATVPHPGQQLQDDLLDQNMI